MKSWSSLQKVGQLTYMFFLFIFPALSTYSYSMKSLLKKHMESTKKEEKGMSELIEKYKMYKENYVKNMIFDPNNPGLSMYII